MDKKCVFCGKNNDLIELDLNYEGQEYSKYVCNTCWECISAIAIRSVKALLYRLATTPITF